MNSTFGFSKANKYKNISGDLKAARFLLIDHVIETKKAIPFEKAAEITGLDKLNELIKKNIVNLNDNNEIAYLYPVATAITGHSVRLQDGRRFDTLCAIDSLGCASTFNMDCEVFSFCKDTGASVNLKILQRKIETALPTTNLFVSYFDNVGGGSCCLCKIMDFFQYEKNARDLLKQYENDGNMYFWTLSDAYKAAQMIFNN